MDDKVKSAIHNWGNRSFVKNNISLKEASLMKKRNSQAVRLPSMNDNKREPLS